MTLRVKMLLIGIGVIVAWVLAAPFMARFLVVDKPLEHADALLVLSGSSVYRERTSKAAELYRSGVAAKVIITNDGERSGWSTAEQTNVPYVELERRELIAGGVPADAITQLSDRVTGTDVEAKALLSEVDARPLSSVLVVTSPYHTRRALRTFERILAGKNIEIGIAHCEYGDRSPSPAWWWLTWRGWRFVALEYVKSAVYYAYY